ncbi:MAG: hypothetical protein LBU05_00905 [Bifidobacteriaceae bacterium]|nr:hypothetical protein [Bifidobacteriaceae bacterium]
MSTTETGFAGAPEPLDLPVIKELKRLRLDGVSTVIQVTRPAVDGRYPVIVFGHGAGTGNHTAFDEHATALARRGLVCLAGDKDLRAYSITRRDYGHMARQYADLAAWGREQAWARPDRVGYYGESEGAWVVPWAASLRRADFIALVSAPVVTAREQGLYAIGRYLDAVGAPASVFDAGVRLAGAVAPRGRFEYLDFNLTRYLPEIDCPVLVVYGAADISMPIVQGAERVMAKVPGPVAVRYYADADHGLRRGPDKHVSRTFLDDLAAWIECLEAEPAVAGAQPFQPFAAVTPPRGGAIMAEAGTGAAALVALAATGLGAAAGPRLRWPLTLAGAGALATIAAHTRYLYTLVKLASGYRTDPVAVRLGHQAVRLLGALSLVAAIIAVIRLRDPGTARATAGALTGLGGASLLLLLAARWGAFGPFKR